MTFSVSWIGFAHLAQKEMNHCSATKKESPTSSAKGTSWACIDPLGQCYARHSAPPACAPQQSWVRTDGSGGYGRCVKPVVFVPAVCTVAACGRGRARPLVIAPVGCAVVVAGSLVGGCALGISPTGCRLAFDWIASSAGTAVGSKIS